MDYYDDVAALREAATELARYRAAQSWMESVGSRLGEGPQAPKVEVRWDIGQAVDGYEPLRDEVVRQVRALMPGLLEQALETMKARVEEKMRRARALMERPSMPPHLPVSE